MKCTSNRGVKISVDKKVLRALKTAQAIEWMGRGYCLHESNRVNKVPNWKMKKGVLSK